MSRKKRMQNIRESKDRRAKRLAIGGVVLLAIVLAYEVPHVLKLGGSSSPAPATTTTAAPAPNGATPTPVSTPATTPPGTAAAAVAPTTSSTRLPNSDMAPTRSKAQLHAFTQFAGKDPFAPQVSASPQGQTADTGGGSTPASASTGSGTASTAAVQTSTAAGNTGGSQPSPARTLAKTGAATISVNGKVQTIRIGASFPSANPLFRLVSVVRGVARIGIANGSYASGTPTVSLLAGHTLTLVDTADGVRYRLQLLTAS